MQFCIDLSYHTRETTCIEGFQLKLKEFSTGQAYVSVELSCTET